jgi:hypothetical protein
MRPALGAWAAYNGLGMVVIVYHLAQTDLVGESVENLIRYGIVRHGELRADAYAALTIEALDTSGRVIGNAEVLRDIPLDAATWQPDCARDKQTVAATGPAAAALQETITRVLQDAVMLAAREAGLSHRGAAGAPWHAFCNTWRGRPRQSACRLSGARRASCAARLAGPTRDAARI